jgi:hypothetical protein
VRHECRACNLGVFGGCDCEYIDEDVHVCINCERVKDEKATMEREIMKKKDDTIRKSREWRNQKIFLKVPFADNTRVKLLGARWDPVNKSWYVQGKGTKAMIELVTLWGSNEDKVTMHDLGLPSKVMG